MLPQGRNQGNQGRNQIPGPQRDRDTLGPTQSENPYHVSSLFLYPLKRDLILAFCKDRETAGSCVCECVCLHESTCVSMCVFSCSLSCLQYVCCSTGALFLTVAYISHNFCMRHFWKVSASTHILRCYKLAVKCMPFKYMFAAINQTCRKLCTREWDIKTLPENSSIHLIWCQ